MEVYKTIRTGINRIFRYEAIQLATLALKIAEMYNNLDPLNPLFNK